MSAPTDWVLNVTHEAMTRLLAHADKVGLANTDECTFRALFMASAHDLLDAPRFQIEWRRFDLLVQVGDNATIVEFKYYVLRRTFGLRGEVLGYKGSAGPKNEAEFRACVHKLRAAIPPQVGDRRLVLAYDRASDRQSRYSFHRSYGDLAASEDIEEVQRLTVDPLEGRVLRPRTT
jgi:hypothetical protein